MKLALLGILLAVTALFRFGVEGSPTVRLAEPVLALGFLLLFSYLVGKWVLRYRLPMITGYLLAGILVGPEFLNLLSAEATDKLHLIDQLALGIIALTAGGELRLAALKAQAKSLGYLVLMQVVVVFAAVGLGFALLLSLLPVQPEQSLAVTAITVLFLVGTAVANSPATAIAVITETSAAGPVSDRVIGVTVIKDVVVLTLFTLIMAVGETVLTSNSAGVWHDFLHLFWSIFGSFLFGGVAGAAIVLYMRWIGEDLPIFVLGATFAITVVSGWLNLEFIMACVAAGFVVENFSPFGDRLILSIERSSLPIYIVFFSIAGASLNLGVLRSVWPLTLLLVSLRLAGTWLGSRWGTALAGDEPAVQRFVWTGFVGQAGVTLGMALLIGRAFAESFGNFLQALIISGIVINQLIGPVIFRIGLEKAGEIGRKDHRAKIEL